MDIKKIITEELKRLFEQKIYTIPELASSFKKMNYDEQGLQVIQKILLRAYQTGGDDAVVDMYTKMAGVQIEAIRNGRYIFANLYTPDDYEGKLEELEDNCNHTPDEMPS